MLYSMRCVLEATFVDAAHHGSAAVKTVLHSWTGARTEIYIGNMLLNNTALLLAPAASIWVCGGLNDLRSGLVFVAFALITLVWGLVYFVFIELNGIIWGIGFSVLVVLVLVQCGLILWNLDRARPAARVVGACVLVWILNWVFCQAGATRLAAAACVPPVTLFDFDIVVVCLSVLVAAPAPLDGVLVFGTHAQSSCAVSGVAAG